MYSLGIILFELYCPFKTDMERVVNIKDVKQSGTFPDQMKKWQSQVTSDQKRLSKT